MHPLAIKALLHFMYSDDLDEVASVLREYLPAAVAEGTTSTGGGGAAAEGTSATGGGGGASEGAAAALSGSDASGPAGGAAMDRVAQLQAVLAAAHKYQVIRLLRWCEQQLCELICCETVCSLLCTAMLYEASELESNCLSYMGDNLHEVAATATYAALPPKALVMVTKHVAERHGVGKKRSRDERA